MSAEAVSRLARAMHDASRRSARHHSKESLRGTVLAVRPLRVEVAAGIVLDDESLTLSQSVAKYHLDYGLAIGDSLVVQPIGRSEFVAVSVVAVATGRGGLGKKSTPSGGTIGGGALVGGTLLGDGVTVTGSVAGTPLVALVPFYDADGTIVGHVPII